jgi:hypothetical protein
MTMKVQIGMVAEKSGSFVKDVLTWNWTKSLLYWLIISAGTMSECVFLLASLWMSVNSSVHTLVRLYMSEETSIHISQFATAAYVALPELILGLAFVTTLSHIRVWLYDRSISAATWSVLYGLPTLVFLVLSLVTLGCSVASTGFMLPEPLVIIRALAGYTFAFTSLLHAQLGVPQERDRLQEKDDFIVRLREENRANLAALNQEKDAFIADLRRKAETMIADLRCEKQSLQSVIENQNGEIEKQKTLIAESKTAQSELLKAMNKTSDSGLEAYSGECVNWLKSGVKTVSIDEITRYTGHSKRKIEGAITRGYLQTSPRNKELILVSSLTSWLKSVPPSTGKTEEIPMLHIVNE